MNGVSKKLLISRAKIFPTAPSLEFTGFRELQSGFYPVKEKIYKNKTESRFFENGDIS